MRPLLFSVFLLLSCWGVAQTPYIDSLKVVNPTLEDQKEKINNYCVIGYLSIPFDYDQTESYLDSARTLSEEIGYPYGLITSTFYRGIYMENFSENDTVIAIVDQVLTLLEEYRDSFEVNYISDYRKEVLQVKARNLVASNKISEASEIYYELIEDLSTYLDTTSTRYATSKVELYRNLGNLFFSSNPQLSREYFDKSINLGRKHQVNLSPQFNGLYHALERLKAPEDSLYAVLDSAILYGAPLDDQWWSMEAYTHYCWRAAKSGREDADYYCNKADSLNSFFQTDLYESEIANGRALIAASKGKVSEAKQYFEIALDKGMDYELLEYRIQLTSDAFEFYKSIGETDKASEMADLYIQASKTYYEDNLERSFLEAEAKYQSAEKEKQLAQKELELANQRSSRNQILGGSAILLLVSAGVGLWYYQRQSEKKKIAELALENEKLERKKLEELDELKTQFFTNVSHELKTPLTLILGPLSNTIEKTSDKASKENLLLAYNNAERLNELINETLDLAKLEKGKMKINKEPRPIAKDLIRSFLSFSSLAEMRDIQLEGHVHFSEDKYINCDIDKIEKILNNLVSNAIKFSENGSKVVMNATMDDVLRIDVIDYGKGIPEDEQELVFNRFYQAKHNQYGSYGGTGIGLAFSKEIAELLHGNLNVRSEEGKGSTFTLSIPIEYAEAPEGQDEILWEAPSIEKDRYQPLLINGEQPRILIVEDNKEMQQYLKSLLEEDYNCDFAADGFEAIRKVQSQRYHLISSDVMMPNMDGFILKERINQLPDYRKIPFIFLTARSLEEDKLSGLRLGVDDYITKPFNKSEYQIRINNLLKNHKERMMAEKEFSDAEVTESVDNKILKDAETIILKNLENPAFKVTDLADELHYSQRQVARIIKQLTGLTPVNFILELRLQMAYKMIKSRSYRSISEVRYAIGIESASYFTRKFKERFGISPSEL